MGERQLVGAPTVRPGPHPRARLLRRRGERGAVLIEAALVFPVFLLLVFGVVEFSLALQTDSTAAAATRSAARIGSAAPKQPDYQGAMVAQVNTAFGALAFATPQELWIFRAATDSAGRPTARPHGTDAATFSWTLNTTNCPTAWCTGYVWSNGAFTPAAGWATSPPNPPLGWPAGTFGTGQDACLNLSEVPPRFPQTLGAFVKLRHNFVTRFFGSSITMTDTAIMRLEPLPVTQCRGSRP